MEIATLSDLLKFLEKGTNLKVGVSFFGNFWNNSLSVEQKQTIHTSPVCCEFKSTSFGYKKCFTCRNLAFEKAFKSKQEFEGICIHGIYEYVKPVVIDGKVAAIIFIGNISDNGKGFNKLKSALKNNKLLSTLEYNFSSLDCKKIAYILENYIRLTFEKYPPSKSINPLMENVKSHILSNLEYDISLEQLSFIFGYNPKYFGRLFKREMGITVKEFINNERLNKAKKLLLSTNLSVIEIALQCGYNNVTYFNKIFKAEEGKTPSAFRNLFK